MNVVGRLPSRLMLTSSFHREILRNRGWQPVCAIVCCCCCYAAAERYVFCFTRSLYVDSTSVSSHHYLLASLSQQQRDAAALRKHGKQRWFRTNLVVRTRALTSCCAVARTQHLSQHDNSVQQWPRGWWRTAQHPMASETICCAFAFAASENLLGGVFFF